MRVDGANLFRYIACSILFCVELGGCVGTTVDTGDDSSTGTDTGIGTLQCRCRHVRKRE